MELHNLFLFLKATAEKNPNAGIIYYLPGQVNTVGKELKYSDLLKKAKENASFIHQLGLEPGTIILLHFNNHVDNIEWFWSVVCAGFVPALSTPFTNNLEQRKKHIEHLHALLGNPLCLTRNDLLTQFSDQNLLRLHSIDKIPSVNPSFNGLENRHGIFFPVDQGMFKTADTLAVLMLTSGSSGNAKAVCLTHEQMLTSVMSKSKALGTNGAPFLNWINFDHVACLTETHLQAMLVGADQIMVQAEDIVSNPLVFLELVNKHRAAISFAPNFFLASLRRALESHGTERFRGMDFSCLQSIVSGGEANVVETCVALAKLLEEYGVRSNVLSPTFGMTETCAGAIYNTDCPRRDVECNNEFATVGSCVAGIEMRMTDENGEDVGRGVTGNLEVSGPIVFSKYYNNPEATADSFNGKFFKTGDRGHIDLRGDLHLTGRSKETIIINGVNYFPYEIEAILDDVSGAKPSYTVVFPYRSPGSQTESLCVVYYPTYTPEDIETLVEANDAITNSVMLQTGIRPTVIPLDGSVLQKSTLGKLSRAKIRASFEKEEFQAFQKFHEASLADYRAARHEAPANTMEELILKTVQDLFNVLQHELGVKTNIFSLGIDSIGLIKLKQKLQMELNIDNIPIITIMTYSTIRSLAVELENLQKPRVYNPMVVLQSEGAQIPLWLIHPGVGEILVFFKLASNFQDRPIYAMRAPGFEEGEKHFQSVAEIVTTYYDKIKEVQPIGPYAIAGYSYGSMIAFEITKLLLENKDEVKFLGILNLPPHIAWRMRQFDWANCLLHLAYFLDLFSEEYAHSKHSELKSLPKEKVLQLVMQVAPADRMAQLGLDSEKLSKWADVAYSLQSSAVDYEPSGMVDNIDVFCAIPLVEAAKDMEDWKINHLAKWGNFSRTAPRLHEVEGAHYTMIGPKHVYTFQKRLKAALKERGI